MEINEAIKILHEGKTKKLDAKPIIMNGKFGCRWNPDEDVGWQRYKEAVRVIENRPKLKGWLEKINYI